MKQRVPLVLAAGLITAQASAAITFFIEPEHCAHADGRVITTVTGGVPPYTYSWSNGATTQNLVDVPAGIYTLTVTDFLGAEQQNTAVVPNQAFWDTYTGYEAVTTCDGSSMAHVLINAEGVLGPGPHSFTGACAEFNPWQGEWSSDYDNLPTNIVAICSWGVPGTTYTTGYTDAMGCPGSIEVPVPAPPQFNPMAVVSVQGACSGLSNGSATLYSPPEQEYIFLANPRLYDPGWVQNADVSSYGSNWSYGGTYQIPNLAAGTYAFVRRLRYDTDNAPWFDCGDTTYFTIPDLGIDCGTLSGRAFMDYNLNCTRQTNEPYAPGSIMEILPGPYYASTGNDGLYSLTLPTGNYTVEQQSELVGEHCAGGPIPFSIATGQNTVVNFPDTSAVPLDVQISMAGGLARPGFEFQYAINVRNLTPAGSGSASVTFTFDPALSFLFASPTPTNVTGNTITWNQSQLTAFQQRNYTIRFQVPPDVGLLGYELEATANVTTNNADGNLANNSATNLRTITGSYDPNDKLAHTSGGNTSTWEIDQDEWIDYTIRFQNTGTDTAFHVIITDTLPSTLDPGSLRVGAGSHPFTWSLVGQGVLRFVFLNILLPDSNINEPLSHGFVGFRIRPHLPILPGTAITNIANIYFDFNPPVITEPSVLVAEFSTTINEAAQFGMTLAPVPATDFVTITTTVPITRLSIHTLDGRSAHVSTASGLSHTIDVRSLSDGAYILSTYSKEGQRFSQRLIKQTSR